MTAITTSPHRLEVATGPAGRPRAGAGFATATVQSARRTVLQLVRSPQLVVLPIVMSSLFLFLFRYIFGGAIGGSHGVDYVDYLVPGFLVSTILWTGMNAPSGVAEDAASGVHDRFRSLPIPRAAVVTGRSLADATLICATIVVTTGLGFAVGFSTHAGIGPLLLAAALLALAGYTFAWVFVCIGLWAGNAQGAQAMASLLVVPLTFVSSAYVPVASMPSWMQTVAANQPLTAMINAVRCLVLGGTHAAGVGHTTTYWVLLSVAWCAGILAVFSALAVARFSRTR